MNSRLIEERMKLAYAQYQELSFHRHRNPIQAQVHRWDDLCVDSH